MNLHYCLHRVRDTAEPQPTALEAGPPHFELTERLLDCYPGAAVSLVVPVMKVGG